MAKPNRNHQDQSLTGRSLTRRERRQRAYDMRKARWTYHQIAQALEVSYSTARYDVDWMARYMEATFAEDIAEQRQQVAEALGDLHRVAYTIATDPNRNPDQRLRAIDRAIAAADRRSRLLGLDAPPAAGGATPPTFNLKLDIQQLSGEDLDRELAAFQVGVDAGQRQVEEASAETPV